GNIDLVVANVGNTLDRGSVSVFLNDGLANFPTPSFWATGLQPISVATGSFTNSGLPDIAAANSVSNDVTVWLNDPALPGQNFVPLTDPAGNPLTLSTPSPYGVNPRKILVGDFRGNGLNDIAVLYFGDFGVTRGNITIFLNTGDPAHPFSNDLQFVGLPGP